MTEGRATTRRASRYRTLARLAPVGIFHADADGQCCYVSRRLTELTEISLRKARADGWLRAVHPADVERVRKEWAKCVRDGEAMHCEYRFRRRDRSIIWVLTQTVPERDPAGRVVGFVGTITDITRRKKVEAELRLSEQRYQALAECAGVGISHLSLDGSTLYLNTAMRAMLELEPQEDYRGLRYEQFFTAQSAARIGQELRGRASGVISSYQAELVGRHGTHRTVVISGAPVRGPDGRVQSVIGTIIDVTARRKAEEALQQARDELEVRVRQRTAELERANQSLADEVMQRQKAEQALRESERHHREAAEYNKRLVMEVDHRVRNNLAGLLSVLSLTRASAQDLKSFADAIEGRLLAMVRVHDALAATGWRPVGMRAMLWSLLEALRRLCGHSADIRIEGEDALLGTRQALPLMMVVQEWFTNSHKYGALSCAGGHVRIRCELSESGDSARVRLRWTESGGPPILHPVRPSLGTELVKAFITRELRGACQMRYPAAGADHEIEFPAQPDENVPQIAT